MHVSKGRQYQLSRKLGVPQLILAILQVAYSLLLTEIPNFSFSLTLVLKSALLFVLQKYTFLTPPVSLHTQNQHLWPNVPHIRPWISSLVLPFSYSSLATKKPIIAADKFMYCSINENIESCYIVCATDALGFISLHVTPSYPSFDMVFVFLSMLCAKSEIL